MATTSQPVIIQESADVDSAAELSADLDHLRDLLANAPIAEARTFVKELERRWPHADPVKHFARVLAPPVARRVPAEGLRARNREPELAWLREHAAEYPGCWLGLLGDRLITADADLNVVLEKLRVTPGGEQALLHFQPLPRENP